MIHPAVKFGMPLVAMLAVLWATLGLGDRPVTPRISAETRSAAAAMTANWTALNLQTSNLR
jgi:hypothetical protein